MCQCGCGLRVKDPRSYYLMGHRPLKELPPKICKCCSNLFDPPRPKYSKIQFCSTRCVNVYKGRLIEKTCLYCDKKFDIAKSKIDRGANFGKYCSHTCRLAYWSRRSVSTASPTNYRKNAWKFYDKKCYDCGWDEIKELLIVHHIDGNRKNGAISNLVPLCPRCHSIRHYHMNGQVRVPTQLG